MLAKKFMTSYFFQIFLKQKINIVIMTYLQANFQLSWLSISRAIFLLPPPPPLRNGVSPTPPGIGLKYNVVNV